MVKKSAASNSRRFLGVDGTRQTIANEILLRLPRRESAELRPKLELVRLQLHQVLHEAGETIRSGYFVNSGMQSVLSIQPDGKSVEVGLIGKEGFAGLPALDGFVSSPTRVITQADGTAYRVDMETLTHIVSECPQLQKALRRFGHCSAMQAAQIAACNRLHDVEERLARWLLMSQDRIGSDQLPLTQEFLAQMLGTRRSSVSVAASILQKAGMISYTRGNVTILNKSKLADAACDCYQMIQEQEHSCQAETQ